ncbi:MAG: hypothetical protein LBI28_09990 [Treponema sp.]|jgi:hypothetical protein|nr:hypothetical protein [Treponema sp.]
MDKVNYIFILLLFFIPVIFELLFWKKIILKYGITIYKKTLLINKNVCTNYIGKILEKEDAIIEIISNDIFIFEANRKLLFPQFDPIIHGFCKINKDTAIIKIKKPLAYIPLIIYFIFLFYSFGIISNIIFILIFSLIFLGIPVLLNYLKIKSMIYDIEYFINTDFKNMIV